MKIQVPRNILFDAVQLVSHIIPSKTTKPILSHIHVSVEDNNMILTTSDGEVWIERVIPVQVEEPGALTMPGKMVADVLGGLPESEVRIESGDGFDFKLLAGVSDYDFQGFDPSQFTAMPVVEKGSQFNVPGQLLKDMVDQVKFAISSDESRPILTGILLHFDGMVLRLVATDTHRLAVRDNPLEADIDGTIYAVIPERAVNLFYRAVIDAPALLGFTTNQVTFEVDGTRIVSMLIEGQFPNYQRVIPANFTRRWVTSKDELVHAVRRAEVVAKDNMHRVVFKTEGERLVLSAKSELGKAYEEIDLAREGDEVEVVMNGKYILDVVNVIQTEGVAFELTEPVRPVVVKSVGAEANYQCVIMPMSS